jgi:DHA1 family putative efflux transporter-like MFS transporter
MSATAREGDAPSLGRLFLPSLFTSNLVSGVPIIISGILLVDIGESFGYPVGVAGQISTAFSVITIIFALALGVLSTRYAPRTLLTAGLLLNVISAIGSYTSTSFPMLILTYSLTGISSAIVFPMTATIIGERLPPERSSSALGWATAGNPFSVLIGAPLVSYIAGQYGWRATFILVLLPVSILGLILVYLGIPRTRSGSASTPRDASEGYRRIISNRSAVACLLGAMFVSMNLSNVLTYGVSSLRERFQASAGLASLAFSGMAVTAFLGNIITGSVINRLSRKRILAPAPFLLGILTMIMFNIGPFWPSVVVSIMLWLFGSSAFLAGNSLSLEQDTEFRGTMMSLNSVARGIGSAVGTIFGGLVLLQYSYSTLGYAAGVFGILAVLAYHFSEDPTRDR